MCLICQIGLWIKAGKILLCKELETGYVVIGDHQYFKELLATLFLAKEHTCARTTIWRLLVFF